MRTPEAAVNFMMFAEIGSQRDYTPGPKWPGGASGVTIGIGYDLGYHTAAEISVDWQPYLDNGSLKKLVSCSRVTGTSARVMAQLAGAVLVPFDAAVNVFRGTSVARAEAQTIAAFANCDLLPDQSFGALVSLVYNRGADTSNTPNRLEMHEIADSMALCRFADVPDLIRKMKRLWEWPNGVAKAGFGGLVTRRDAEAAMFSYGLENSPPDAKAIADRLDAGIQEAV